MSLPELKEAVSAHVREGVGTSNKWLLLACIGFTIGVARPRETLVETLVSHHEQRCIQRID